MSLPYNQEVVAIREWLTKENYLPKNFDDDVIRKFLHSCYGSMEQTKKCIEKFCVSKCSMPEVFTNRDPLTPKMQTACSITCISNLAVDTTEMIFFEIDDPELERFNFYDTVKLITVFAEHWIMTSEVYAEEHLIFVDLKHFFLRIITKCDLFLVKQFIVYLLEAMPVRIKEVHAYNCPPYYEKMYALIKAVIPQEIRDRIHFHLTMNSLHKSVDKKYLPLELDGTAPSIKEKNRYLYKDISESYRSKFQDDTFWKADLTRRLKTNPSENQMNGSFKTLNID